MDEYGGLIFLCVINSWLCPECASSSGVMHVRCFSISRAFLNLIKLTLTISIEEFFRSEVVGTPMERIILTSSSQVKALCRPLHM